jgi:hypothetical protein
MSERPETENPGSPSPHADGWNMERLWSRPLAHLSNTGKPERVPGLSQLRQSLHGGFRGKSRLAAHATRNAEARQRLLDELARIDITLP